MRRPLNRVLLGHLEVGLTRESRSGRLQPLAFRVAREVVLQPVCSGWVFPSFLIK